MPGPGKPFVANNNANPSGRPRATDDERAAAKYLRDRTLGAAQRLVQLQASDDEKIALGATLGHLKITLGTLERQAGPNGEAPVNPYAAVTVEELKAIARAQIEKERAK